MKLIVSQPCLFSLLIGASDIKILITGKFFGVVIWLFFCEDAYRVNGFDESFHGWGLDDSDFAVRMINSGVRIKSGRFSTGVFHLCHREGSLVKDSFNSSRFSKVIKDRLVNPLKGLAGEDCEALLRKESNFLKF